jgi:hypothetical protein
MKLSSKLRAFYLAVAALVLSTTAAMATNEPIPGVDIIVKKDPGGLIVQKGSTSPTGQVTFSNLLPGNYLIELNGNALGMALKKIDPKGLLHTIVVTVGLPGEKPIATSSQPYSFPVAASLAVHVAVGDLNGDASKAKPLNYTFTITLAK